MTKNKKISINLLSQRVDYFRYFSFEKSTDIELTSAPTRYAPRSFKVHKINWLLIFQKFFQQKLEIWVTILVLCKRYLCLIFITRNSSCAKVMFSQVPVCPYGVSWGEENGYFQEGGWFPRKGGVGMSRGEHPRGEWVCLG